MKNNKQFLVRTPAGNVIHISDDEDFIEIRDRKSNIIKIDISSGTVLIKTANKVLIEAETEVSVKAGIINLNP